MIMQKVYVFIAFFPVINNLFVHKRLKLSKSLGNYSIVGGNHRIRLFDKDLTKINVLLKEGENTKFLTNDAETRINNRISYAPRILASGKDWLVEEFVSGVPFNRINDKELLESSFEIITKKHLNELLTKTKKTISIEVYLQNGLDEIYLLISLITNNEPLKIQLQKTVKIILDNIKQETVSSIESSLTHGDFQKGNMRITSKNETIVLDWEAADTRFYLYDLYVLLSGIREGKELKFGFSLFFDNIENYERINNMYSKKAVMSLLCLEELRFNLNEDVSPNYFQQGIKSYIVAKAIDNLLLN